MNQASASHRRALTAGAVLLIGAGAWCGVAAANPATTASSARQQDAAAPARLAQPETFVYIADFQPAGIAQYRVGADGGLVALKPGRARVGRAPRQITVDKAGRFAYVYNKDGSISHCQVAPDGMLTARRVPDALPRPDAKSQEGPDYGFLFLDEPQNIAYVIGDQGNRIARFALGRDRVLRPLAPLLVPGAWRIAPRFSLDRTILYVAYVLQKDVDALRPLGRQGEHRAPIHYDTYRLNGRAVPKKIASLVVVGGGNLHFDPRGRFAFVPRRDAIGCYRVQSDGIFSFTGDVAVPSGETTIGMTFAPRGNAVYIHHSERGRHVLSQFKVDDEGLLVPLSPQKVPVEGSLVNETLDPTGRFLYATSIHTGNTMDRFVVGFRIGQDGRLQRIAQARTETGDTAGLPDIDPSGRFAYVTTTARDPKAGAGDTGRLINLLQFKIEADGTWKPLPRSKIRMNYFWNMTFVQKAATKRGARSPG